MLLSFLVLFYYMESRIVVVFSIMGLPQFLAYIALAIYTAMYPEMYVSPLPSLITYLLLGIFVTLNVIHLVIVCSGMGTNS